MPRFIFDLFTKKTILYDVKIQKFLALFSYNKVMCRPYRLLYFNSSDIIFQSVISAIIIKILLNYASISFKLNLYIISHFTQIHLKNTFIWNSIKHRRWVEYCVKAVKPQVAEHLATKYGIRNTEYGIRNRE